METELDLQEDIRMAAVALTNDILDQEDMEFTCEMIEYFAEKLGTTQTFMQTEAPRYIAREKELKSNLLKNLKKHS